MWRTVKISDVCEFQSGLWKGKKGPFTDANVIRNTNFRTNGTLSYENIAFLEVETKELSKRQLQHGDIILEKSGGGEKTPVGRVCLFKKQDSKIPFSLSNFTCFIRVKEPSILDYKYLHKFLNFMYVSGKTNSMQRNSTGIRNLQLKEYKDISIPLPPIAEQQRIVAKLDAGFTEIDKIILSGEIKKSEIKKLYASSITSIFFSDKDTKVIEIKEIAKIKGGKRLPKGEKLTSEVTKFPYIRVKDFTKEGSINEDSIKYVSEDVKKKISRYTISVEDVYISIAGTIGRTGVIPSSLNNANLTENAAKIVLDNNCLRDYFYYFTTSASFINQTIAQTRATAQPKLSLERLEKVKLPLCSINKQKFIVDKAHKIQKYKDLLLNIIDKEIKLYKVLKSKIIQDLIKI